MTVHRSIQYILPKIPNDKIVVPSNCKFVRTLFFGDNKFLAIRETISRSPIRQPNTCKMI